MLARPRLNEFRGEGGQPPSLARSFLDRFDEFERHPIALSDCEILGTVLLSKAQGWRQIPNRLISRVLGICVDLRGGGELEAGLLRKLDHIVLAHIAVLRIRILRLRWICAMVGYSEDTPGLQ